jgi:hypothetical protein
MTHYTDLSGEPSGLKSFASMMASATDANEGQTME